MVQTSGCNHAAPYSPKHAAYFFLPNSFHLFALPSSSAFLVGAEALQQWRSKHESRVLCRWTGTATHTGERRARTGWVAWMVLGPDGKLGEDSSRSSSRLPATDAPKPSQPLYAC
eukprot:scaffold184_cov379-Prasinococcus_capsulatus_cf.AAC.9